MSGPMRFRDARLPEWDTARSGSLTRRKLPLLPSLDGPSPWTGWFRWNHRNKGGTSRPCFSRTTEKWRRERDSNPRTGISRYTISNRAPSTSSAISPNGCCPWSLVTAKIIIPDFFPPSSFFSKKFHFFCRPGNGPLREAVSAAPFCQIARKRGLLFPLIFHGEN